MPQTPLPPGEPIRPRDGEIRWFEPVIVARHATEQSVVGEAVAAPPPLSLRRQAMPWREVCCVGFASDADASGLADAGAPRPPMASARVATQDAPAPGRANDDVAGRGESRPEPAARAAARGSPAAAAKAAQPAAAEDEPVPRSRVVLTIVAAAQRLQRELRSSISRLLRLGVAAAAIGAVAGIAYQGGERLAGLAGAMTRPASAPGRQAAALPAPDGYRAPTMPPNDLIERAADLDRARAGDPIAQYNIAVLYARGDGLAQDFSSAAAWFREAASTGNAAAQFNLAVLYERGLGVSQNMGEAIVWYRRAAERNYAVAQYNLAIAYAEGRGLPQDAVAAAHWYHQAAMQGLVPAMVNFAILYEKGEGVERSLPDAYAWYRAAARHGDAAAEQRARELFQQFTGSEKGRAVMVAAAVAETIHQSSAEPARSSLMAPGPGGSLTVLRAGSWTGRAVIEPAPSPVQRPG